MERTKHICDAITNTNKSPLNFISTSFYWRRPILTIHFPHKMYFYFRAIPFCVTARRLLNSTLVTGRQWTVDWIRVSHNTLRFKWREWRKTRRENNAYAYCFPTYTNTHCVWVSPSHNALAHPLTTFLSHTNTLASTTHNVSDNCVQ